MDPLGIGSILSKAWNKISNVLSPSEQKTGQAVHGALSTEESSEAPSLEGRVKQLSILTRTYNWMFPKAAAEHERLSQVLKGLSDNPPTISSGISPRDLSNPKVLNALAMLNSNQERNTPGSEIQRVLLELATMLPKEEAIKDPPHHLILSAEGICSHLSPVNIPNEEEMTAVLKIKSLVIAGEHTKSIHSLANNLIEHLAKEDTPAPTDPNLQLEILNQASELAKQPYEADSPPAILVCANKVVEHLSKNLRIPTKAKDLTLFQCTILLKVCELIDHLNTDQAIELVNDFPKDLQYHHRFQEKLKEILKNVQDENKLAKVLSAPCMNLELITLRDKMDFKDKKNLTADLAKKLDMGRNNDRKLVLNNLLERAEECLLLLVESNDTTKFIKKVNSYKNNSKDIDLGELFEEIKKLEEMTTDKATSLFNSQEIKNLLDNPTKENLHATIKKMADSGFSDLLTIQLKLALEGATNSSHERELQALIQQATKNTPLEDTFKNLPSAQKAEKEETKSTMKTTLSPESRALQAAIQAFLRPFIALDLVSSDKLTDLNKKMETKYPLQKKERNVRFET